MTPATLSYLSFRLKGSFSNLLFQKAIARKLIRDYLLEYAFRI